MTRSLFCFVVDVYSCLSKLLSILSTPWPPTSCYFHSSVTALTFCSGREGVGKTAADCVPSHSNWVVVFAIKSCLNCPESLAVGNKNWKRVVVNDQQHWDKDHLEHYLSLVIVVCFVPFSRFYKLSEIRFLSSCREQWLHHCQQSFYFHCLWTMQTKSLSVFFPRFNVSFEFALTMYWMLSRTFVSIPT
jgi:hypothetical protein